MINFRGNIDNWIRNSGPDYYMLFIKAWIPFNAWYVAEMPDLNKKDTLLIKELQDNPNSRPRKTIEALLLSNSAESQNFKSNLSFLHQNLERKHFTHNSQRLTFTSIELSRNPIRYKTAADKYGNKFKAEFKSNYYEAIVVDKNGKTICNYRHTQYLIDDLKCSMHYIGLDNQKIQAKILDCFCEINPNKPINLVSNSKVKTEFILLGSDANVRFINDVESVAKACIRILYSLRCMLFHGEVDPTSTNAVVYEHAYYLLRHIIKELN